jgi:16S rRNA processing protein RimM
LAKHTSPTVLLGHVAGVHGLAGELKLILELPNDQLPEELVELFLAAADGRLYPTGVERFRTTMEGQALVKLEGYTTREAAQSLRGTAIHIAEDLLLEGEGTDEDTGLALQDYTVFDAARGQIGTVLEVIPRLDQPILQVVCTFMPHAGTEVLIPLHPDLIVRIDDDAAEIHLQLPEGLLEVYLRPGA